MVDASAGVEDPGAFHKLFYLFKTRGGSGGWGGIWGAAGWGGYLYFPLEFGLQKGAIIPLQPLLSISPRRHPPSLRQWKFWGAEPLFPPPRKGGAAAPESPSQLEKAFTGWNGSGWESEGAGEAFPIVTLVK